VQAEAVGPCSDKAVSRLVPVWSAVATGVRYMQALLINSDKHPLPDGSTGLFQDMGWDLIVADDYVTAMDALRANSVDAVLLSGPRDSANNTSGDEAFANFVRIIDAQNIAAIMVSNGTSPTTPSAKSLIDVVDGGVSLAELRGRFAMIERYHSQFKRVEQELRNMERVGKRLDRHFRELDDEMRLAARLQRDFLPRIDKPIDNVQFATVYRPASWVSGDIFDVFRIDERHTGFYVADAVGHGMAASLLTMFIKRSIVTKRVEGENYAVLSPSETMAGLNDSLADQSLPNCQFVTACYALLDHQTLNLQCARAGHPYPILITPDGIVSELKSTGGLLGISKEQDFPTFEIQLRPGDKLLIYTDGVELAFQGKGDDSFDTTAYHRAFEARASLPVDKMLREIDIELDDEKGSLNPRDDVTIVGLEVLAS